MIGVLRLLLKDLEPPIDGLWINELMDHRDDLMKDSLKLDVGKCQNQLTPYFVQPSESMQLDLVSILQASCTKCQVECTYWNWEVS